MISSSLPYGLLWTSKLIRRDLKSLTTKCTSKLRSLFTSPADTSAPSCDVFDEIESPTDANDLHFSTTTSFRSFDSSVGGYATSTAPTEATSMSAECHNTLYSMLSTKLKELYASRQRDLSPDERWRFRGSWLLLDMATQNCTSNPSYDILRSGYAAPSEGALLLEVLNYTVSKPFNSPAMRISQPPSMPHTNRDSEHTRYDSAYSTISHEHTQCPPAAMLSSPPQTALFWYIVFAGATDRTMTVQSAERLLDYIWPGKDAAHILEVVGNPAKQLSEDESIELRDKLRQMLYPEYDALC